MIRYDLDKKTESFWALRIWELNDLKSLKWDWSCLININSDRTCAYLEMVNQAPSLSQWRVVRLILLREKIYLCAWKILNNSGYIMRFLNVKDNSLKHIVKVKHHSFVDTEIVKC